MFELFLEAQQLFPQRLPLCAPFLLPNSSVKCSCIVYACRASQTGEQEGPLTFNPQLVEGSPNKLLSRMKIDDIFYQMTLAQASKCQEENI